MQTRPTTMASLALALGVASGAGAQQAERQEREPPRVTLALAAGGSVPTGTSGDLLRHGLHFGVVAEVRSWVPWVSGRIDATFQRFGWESPDAALAPLPEAVELHGRRRVTAGMASAVLRVPGARWPVRPYAFGGVGAFRLEDRLTVSGVEVPGGTNAHPIVRGGVAFGLGADVRVAGLALFAEARHERIGIGRALLRTVPVSVGLRF